MRKKLSVICPLYKVRKYATELLESFSSGFNSPDIEVVFVDDHCPELTGRFIEEYITANPSDFVFDYKVIHHTENKGIGSSRNTGVTAATGQYITFIDSDDIISSKYWEKVREHLDNNLCSDKTVIEFGYCEFRDVDDFDDDNIKFLPVKGNLQPFFTQFFLWSRIYSRDLLPHLTFEHRNYEDIPVIAKVFMEVNNLIVINEVLIGYRQRHDSLTKMRDSSYAGQVVNLIDAYRPYLCDCSKELYYRLVFKLTIILLKGVKIKETKERKKFFEIVNEKLKSDLDRRLSGKLDSKTFLLHKVNLFISLAFK